MSDAKLAVSVFHAFAHEMTCQVEYNPRFIDGFGLTDGEWLERLWSFPSGFVKLTRRMTPEHRMLTLSLALDHFKKEKILNIGKIL